VKNREVEIIRCICSRKVVLAYVKFDGLNKPYVHIKIYKQKQIFGEVIFSFGQMRVRCRECLRWHEIRIRYEKTEVEEVSGNDLD
jgi:hypothetical protein